MIAEPADTFSGALAPLRALGLRAARGRGGADARRTARARLTRINVMTGLIALGVALFHVWTGLQVWRLGYALSDARALTQRLEQERQELSVEYAAATAPARLEREARERLGLVAPSPGQVVVLR